MPSTYLVATVVPIRMLSTESRGIGVPRGIGMPIAFSKICRIPSVGASEYSSGETESNLKMMSLCPGTAAQL